MSRLEHIKFALSNGIFAVYEPVMQSAIDFLQGENISAISSDERANNSVVYTEIGTLAVIDIEGAMYKKNIGGFCMSVLSYPDIIAKIDQAEANPKITDIMFWVDTPGGDINGLDELADRIYTSPKTTHTLYKNGGYSAGIYAFSGSKYRYASSKNTKLGSIGVVLNVKIPKEDGSETLTMYSENAENKGLTLDEKGKARLREQINTHEKIFYDIVERNTGFDKERIKTVFNNGDVIFAEKALEEGFISDIISFNELTNKLVAKAVPTSVNSNKPANNIKKEKSMEISKEDILASAEYLELQASHKAEVEKLSTSHTDAIAQAVLSTKEETEKQFRGMAKEVIVMSLDKGLSKDLAVSLMDATDLVSAKAMLVDSMTSEGAIGGKQDNSKKSANTISWQSLKKGDK